MTTKKTADEMSAIAADAVGSFIRKLSSDLGMPQDCVLAGAHAEIITTLVVEYGGDTVAGMCLSAAMRIQNLPSRTEAASLAHVRPAGHA